MLEKLLYSSWQHGQNDLVIGKRGIGYYLAFSTPKVTPRHVLNFST